MLLLRSALLLAVLALPAAGQSRQTDNFNWSGRVQPGRWVRIRNLNGSISVGQASGDNVEVTATKRWRRGDPNFVRIETKKFGVNDENVLICALWGENSSCDEHNYTTRGDRRDRRDRGRDDDNNNNDVSVEFRVLVPKGVKVGVNTINGALTVDNVTAQV